MAAPGYLKVKSSKKSRHGFSLAGALIAVLLVGFAALQMGQMFSNLFKVGKFTENRIDFENFRANFTQVVSSGEACQGTFRETNDQPLSFSNPTAISAAAPKKIGMVTLGHDQLIALGQPAPPMVSFGTPSALEIGNGLSLTALEIYKVFSSGTALYKGVTYDRFNIYIRANAQKMSSSSYGGTTKSFGYGVNADSSAVLTTILVTQAAPQHVFMCGSASSIERFDLDSRVAAGGSGVVQLHKKLPDQEGYSYCSAADGMRGIISASMENGWNPNKKAGCAATQQTADSICQNWPADPQNPTDTGHYSFAGSMTTAETGDDINLAQIDDNKKWTVGSPGNSKTYIKSVFCVK